MGALPAAAWALPAGALREVGPPQAGPAALVVLSPGLAPAASDGLLRALRRAGLDTWVLDLPLEAQDLEQLSQVDIPEALAALAQAPAGARPVALVGHGAGGLAAALAVASGAAHPDALALLGAPLAPSGSALQRWLADRPLPESSLDLNAWTQAAWRDHAALALLLGDPLPPLAPVSRAWLADLAAFARGGAAVDLRAAPCPVWAGVASRDNLAPPETVHPSLPDAATFVRFGYLNLDRLEPDNADLLGLASAQRALSRWLRRTLRGEAP